MKDLCRPIRLNMAPAAELPDQIGHYIKPKSRDPEEIARLKSPSYRSGTLMLEEQTSGLGVVKKGFEACTDPEEFAEWSDLASAAALGTALYLMEDPTGQTAQRYTRMPKLGADKPEDRPTPDDLRTGAIKYFDMAHSLSFQLLASHACGVAFERRKTVELATAKALVHASFLAGCVDVAKVTSDPDAEITNHDTQLWVRERCLELVRNTVSIGLENSALPSVAQLATGGHYTPLVVAVNQAGSQFQADTVNDLVSSRS